MGHICDFQIRNLAFPSGSQITTSVRSGGNSTRSGTNTLFCYMKPSYIQTSNLFQEMFSFLCGETAHDSAFLVSITASWTSHCSPAVLITQTASVPSPDSHVQVPYSKLPFFFKIHGLYWQAVDSCWKLWSIQFEELLWWVMKSLSVKIDRAYCRLVIVHCCLCVFTT